MRYLVTLLLMSLATMVPRILPITFLAERKLPATLIAWLRYIPVSILSAMLAKEILFKGEALTFSPDYITATSVAIAVAVLSKNLVLTLISGMFVFAVFQWVS